MSAHAQHTYTRARAHARARAHTQTVLVENCCVAQVDAFMRVRAHKVDKGELALEACGMPKIVVWVEHLAELVEGVERQLGL